MDFRLYDNALGRFHSVDLLAELIPGINLYQFGFNNPVYWSDPTGLFPEIRGTSDGQVHEDADGSWIWNGRDWIGQDGAMSFYNMIDEVTVIGGSTGGNGSFGDGFGGSFGPGFGPVFPGFSDFSVGPYGGGGYPVQSPAPAGVVPLVVQPPSSGGGSGNRGFQIAELMYSVTGAYGGEAFKRGTYTQTNGNTGNFHDRPYKRLSQNAKSHYNFTKDLKLLKKAGVATTVILGSIEVSNGVIQDYKNYTTTGYTDGRHTTIAAVKVGTGVAVGYASGAAIGAIVGTFIPIPFVGTIIGAAVGGYIGTWASEAAGSYMENIYDR